MPGNWRLAKSGAEPEDVRAVSVAESATGPPPAGKGFSCLGLASVGKRNDGWTGVIPPSGDGASRVRPEFRGGGGCLRFSLAPVQLNGLNIRRCGFGLHSPRNK